jgi:hypothetical protein
MRAGALLLTCGLSGLGLGGGCGFGGGGGSADAGPDGPGKGNKDFVADTAEELGLGTFTDSYVWAGAGKAVVEPVAWLYGEWLVDIDDASGPYNGTWASRPTTGLARHGLMLPPFPVGKTPPGATANNYILWISGEIQLDSGAQRLGLAVSNNALVFADVLNPNGTVLAHCTDAAACTLTPAAAGWYGFRLGWKRPGNATGDVLEVQWAKGADTLADLPASRARTRLSSAELKGWRIDGFEAPRSTNHVDKAVALNVVEPLALDWRPQLLGLSGGSPGYANAGQLRIPEDGLYDFRVTPDNNASYRLKLDGEWVTAATKLNPQLAGGLPEDVLNKTLTAGWHDVVLEGYEDGGTANRLRLTFGKHGETLASPLAANVRPLLSVVTAVSAGANLTTLLLRRNDVVQQPITVAAIDVANPPKATAVDVWLRLRPKSWTGTTIKLYPPGAATGIPLSFTGITLVDDVVTDVHAR